jgi:hypothetical protein
MNRVFQLIIFALVLAMPVVPTWGQVQSQPTYSAKIPTTIVTPDTVQTRIGTLRFFDGLPDQASDA